MSKRWGHMAYCVKGPMWYIILWNSAFGFDSCQLSINFRASLGQGSCSSVLLKSGISLPVVAKCSISNGQILNEKGNTFIHIFAKRNLLYLHVSTVNMRILLPIVSLQGFNLADFMTLNAARLAFFPDQRSSESSKQSETGTFALLSDFYVRKTLCEAAPRNYLA